MLRREDPEVVGGSIENLRRQLHDGLSPLLTSACFLATTLRAKLLQEGWKEESDLDEMISLLNQAVAESRSLVTHFERRGAMEQQD